MTNDLLLERPSPGVLLLTFNRPERKNALNHAMTSAFVDEILASNHDPETRVIVVTGAGGNYSSGGDLEEFENLSLRTHPPVESVHGLLCECRSSRAGPWQFPSRR